MNINELPFNWHNKITCTDEHTFEGTQCWHWTAAATEDGYGRVSMQAKLFSTHRFTWELFVGPIPDGFHVDHLCRNRRCCNPAHLEPVTAKENQARRPGVAKSHCIRGHEMTDENTRLYTNGSGSTGRYCRTCQHERNRNRSRKAA